MLPTLRLPLGAGSYENRAGWGSQCLGKLAGLRPCAACRPSGDWRCKTRLPRAYALGYHSVAATRLSGGSQYWRELTTRKPRSCERGLVVTES